MELSDAIRQTLGKGLTDYELGLIARLAQKQLFMGGDTLVRCFDRDTDIFVILEGSAKVFSASDEMVAELTPGSIVGEVSLVDEQPRSATVRAVGEVEVATIPAADLRQLMMDNTRIEAVLMRNIARMLSSRLRVANIQMDGLMAVR